MLGLAYHGHGDVAYQHHPLKRVFAVQVLDNFLHLLGRFPARVDYEGGQLLGAELIGKSFHVAGTLLPSGGVGDDGK